MGNASSGSTDGLADESATEVPSLSSGELCAILKGGAGALARPWGSDSNATDGGFAEFQKATFEECVARGKEADARRDAKIAQELGHADEVDAKVVEEAEAEERELLKGVEQVQTRLFEGKRWEKPKKTRDIGREWKEEAKREIKQTVVEVEGHMVQADTVTNDAWTAVRGLAVPVDFFELTEGGMPGQDHHERPGNAQAAAGRQEDKAQVRSREVGSWPHPLRRSWS